jgi:hypothetical protein
LVVEVVVEEITLPHQVLEVQAVAVLVALGQEHH